MRTTTLVAHLGHLGPIGIRQPDLGEALAAKIKQSHGLVLHSTDENEPRHGYINVKGHTPAGMVDVTRSTNAPEGALCPDCETTFHGVHECEVCSMCGETAPKAAPHGPCAAVVLYDEAEAPNELHRTPLAPHGLDGKQQARLLDIVKAHRP